MGRRRAVLFGVEKYVEKAGFSDLPVVRFDLPLLARSLETSGYEVDATNVGELTKTRLQDKIKAALDDAESDETLIIYFTGHGVYHNRSTYLVPSESGIRNTENGKTHAPEELTDYLVSLDRIKRNIEGSRARNIVFLIDACREGLNYFVDESLDSSKGIKGFIADESYTPQQLQQADEKAVWFVYSCSPGRTSTLVQLMAMNKSATLRWQPAMRFRPVPAHRICARFLLS